MVKVGQVAEKYNSEDWNADSFAAYAEAEINKIDDRMRVVTEEIISTADEFYRDPAVSSRLLGCSLSHSAELRAIQRHLQEQPRKLGDMRGSGLLGTVPENARERLAVLADRMNVRVDLQRTRDEFVDMGTMAANVHKLPAHEKADRLQQLRHEKDYCDSNRDARAAIARRSEPADPSEPSEGGGAATGHDDRDWWKKEPTETGSVAAGGHDREWWDRREDEPAEGGGGSSGPTREDDRYNR